MCKQVVLDMQARRRSNADDETFGSFTFETGLFAEDPLWLKIGLF